MGSYSSHNHGSVGFGPWKMSLVLSSKGPCSTESWLLVKEYTPPKFNIYIDSKNGHLLSRSYLSSREIIFGSRQVSTIHLIGISPGSSFLSFPVATSDPFLHIFFWGGGHQSPWSAHPIWEVQLAKNQRNCSASTFFKKNKLLISFNQN